MALDAPATAWIDLINRIPIDGSYAPASHHALFGLVVCS
jgi:hypothetical protein